MTRLRTSLGPHLPKSPKTDEELHLMAAAAWHQRNVLVVRMDEQHIDEFHMQALRNVGNKLYGPRCTDGQ